MAQYNRDLLAHHELLATGTTGTLLEDALQTPVIKLQSGPLGGDQQIGARIAEGTVDLVIFFWTRCSRSRTIPTSRRCFASRSSGTSRWPAIGPRRIS